MTAPIIPADQWPEGAVAHVWGEHGGRWLTYSGSYPSNIPIPAGHDWRVPVLRPSVEPATPVADFRGWYCAHCRRGVDASEVTYHEQHEACGRVITDDRPPAPQPAPAIDLEQFREAVEMAMEVPLNSAQRQSLQRLLALIDGQALQASPVARRKLRELQDEGFIVNGVAIFDPTTGRRGLVDYLGYVGWHTREQPAVAPVGVEGLLECLPLEVRSANGYDAAWAAGFNEGVLQSRQNLHRALAQQPAAPSREAMVGMELDAAALGRFAKDAWMDSHAEYPAWGRLTELEQAAWLAVGERIKRVIALASAPPSAPVGVERLRRMVEKLAAHVRPTCSELWEEAQAALAQQPGSSREAAPMADVDLKVAVTPYVKRITEAVRAQDCADPLFQILDDYARANLAPLQAENARLRTEVEGLRAERMVVIENHAYWKVRAERLAEALRNIHRAAHDGCSAMDCAREAYAALAQEDRNG